MTEEQQKQCEKLDDEFMQNSLKVKELYYERCKLFVDVLHEQGLDKKECRQKIVSEFNNMVSFMGKAEFSKSCILEYINKKYK